MRRRAIALAGAFQAAALAKSIANRGDADETALAGSLRSIYMIDAASVEQVFGDVAGVRLGLEILVEHFTSPQRDLDHLRCVITLLQLARKLTADADLCQRLRDEVEAARVHARDPGSSPAAEFDRLGEVYLHTISTLRPRVIVRGNSLYLQQARFVSRVRAVLLAGVRAAVLWHQLGGSRLQLLLRGRTLVAAARSVLAEAGA